MNRSSIQTTPPNSMECHSLHDGSVHVSARRSSLASSTRASSTSIGDFGLGGGPLLGGGLEDEDPVQHSQQKLANAADELRPFVAGKCPIVSVPCATEDDTLNYRCKCSFQIIHDGTKFHYAMRSQGQPVLLESSVFPIANQRIQSAMEGLLEMVLNAGSDNADDGFCSSSDEESTSCSSPYPRIVNEHLTSVTFASSWKDDVDGDLIVTLNYTAAVADADTNWLDEAKLIVRLLKLTQLHVRSKKLVLTAVWGGLDACWGSFLRDTIYLIPPATTANGDGSSWQVSCQPQQHTIKVHYQKPEGAFFHPNATVMCRALSWMLDRISIIDGAAGASPRRLLEMYSGCGAHTLALARSGLLSSILAVEMDQRLVDACRVNIQLNLDKTEPQDIEMTPVEVVRGDAGRVAQKQQKRLTAPPPVGDGGDDADDKEEQDFDILLVDPPRQGLDSPVIDLAIQVKSIRDVLIVSCGLEALVRDLKLLSSDFEIINCHQLDLFPRTDSVETLVHLRRRK